MSQSLSAKVMAEILRVWSKHNNENPEQMIADTLNKWEKPTTPPKLLKTRHEDNRNGRVFYFNEESDSNYVIFYIHGGAYYYDIILPHWVLIKKLAEKTWAQVIVPTYRLVPFATYKEWYDLIVTLYKNFCEKNPDKKIILMWDSAWGGFSLALTEYFKSEGIRMPDELILISPWVDVTMENEEIKEYITKDPFLSPEPLKVVAKKWAGDLDWHNWKISPIYWDVAGIKNTTVFVWTSEILYPDIVKFYNMLDKDPSNELIIAEDMNHVYPLSLIPEAKPAVEKMIQVIMR